MAKTSIHIASRVKVKSWEQMVKEFGLAREGVIDVDVLFTEGMKHLCGQEFTVTNISKVADWVHLDGLVSKYEYIITPNMVKIISK